MKKILIISEHFYPSNVIGAVRPTKIAKKLLERGYEVDVFTKYKADTEELNNKKICSNIYAVCDNKPLAYIAPKYSNRSKLYKKLYNVYSSIMNVVNAKKHVKELKNELLENSEFSSKKYDAVFSSFGPLSSLFWGMYYKKTHPETKWICDFRDPVVVKYISPVLHPYYLHIQKKACKKADEIVAVSNGYLERICKGRFKSKAHMIPNGYDLDDLVFLKKDNVNSTRLEMTYVGALYGGDRDLSPLFHAIRDLINENIIDENFVRINYAGNEFNVLINQAEPYGVASILSNKGIMNREDCLKLQSEAHILLISTWNDKNEYGVFPGKMLEYMLIGKPIISFTSGDLPNGEITRVIREGEFGVAYEEICADRDYEGLKNYIKKVYQSFLEKGFVDFSPVQDVVERYEYNNIIKEIEELMNA